MMTKLESTKAEATKAARALKAKMTSKGWKIHVYKDLGWQYDITNLDRHMVVHPAENNAYTCRLSAGKRHQVGYGAWFWYDPNSYSDPNDAVKITLQKAYKFAYDTDRWVQEVIKKIG